MNKKKLPLLNPGISLVDSHCHLDMEAYAEDLTDVVGNAENSGIKTIISIGIDLNSSVRAVTLAKTFPIVYASVGIHPHDVADVKDSDLEALCSLIESNTDGSIVGYGEIGLDFVKQYAEPEKQKKRFADQIAISKNFKLPIIIHDREAHDDILQILKASGPCENGGIMHCFSGDLEYAKKILDLGLYISIPGIVTFKNALTLKKVAKEIPLQSMLLETDGPFLAPMPYRGKRNEPSYLLYTAEEVSRLRDISINEVAAVTTANACRLFKLSHLNAHDDPR